MEGAKSTVLVTGANGFIGRHLAASLAREGWAVRRAVRQSSNDGDIVVGSIGPETDWQVALNGVDAVVHLAARVHHRHDEHAVTLYRDINIEGTLHLARCAARAGVRQFIFVSTVLVHGRSTDGRAPFKEDDVPTPRGLYGMSKAAAEAGLKALAQESDMQVTVVRPPLVYGFGTKGNFDLLTRVMNRGLPLPLAGIRNHRAFVSVQNLSSFIRWRLSHPEPASKFEIFLVADEEQVSTPEFIERLAAAAGKQVRLFRMPTPLLTALLVALGRREAHDSLIGSLALDTSKARSTGWRPEVTLDEGLRMALSEPNA